MLSAYLQEKKNFPLHLKNVSQRYPWWSVVKNLSSNVGDMGSIPGWGTNIPHTIGQLSRHVTTREDCTLQQRVYMLRQRPSTVKKKKKKFFFPPESVNIIYMC